MANGPAATTSSTLGRQTCFVDMPFGKKTDPKSGVEIDFDQVYEKGIRPAVEQEGLQCIRGDREETGGIIHTAMYARLLLAEFVVADMTSANPNVFYELGVRHAARPFTTIPIFATLGAPPFDVNMVRAIPYELSDGKLSDVATAALIAAIRGRIQATLKGPVAKDSPLFQLFDRFPGIEISHELTDVFRDRVQYAAGFRNRLAKARGFADKQLALQELKAIEAELGDLRTAERGVAVDLMLSYRAVEAFDAMIDLCGRFAGEVQDAPIARQQLAFALNRRNARGDRDQAIQILEHLLETHGPSAETLGLLGRIYKDRYREAVKADDPGAEGWLDEAISAYVRGFEAEPLDYYPGINALTLLGQKGDAVSDAEIRRLAPLVTYAALRRGGDKAQDYWTVATVLELACFNRDEDLARRCLPRAVMLARKANELWMLKTTRENLALIAKRRRDVADAKPVTDIIAELDRAAAGAT
jgi:tetratricopeptide (TPR) repeat protein